MPGRLRLLEFLDNRLPFPRKYPWYSFLLKRWVYPRAVVRPEGLSERRIAAGIETATCYKKKSSKYGVI